MAPRWIGALLSALGWRPRARAAVEPEARADPEPADERPSALLGLLATLRADAATNLGIAAGGTPEPPRIPCARPERERSAAGARLRLAVDDAGEFLTLVGTEAAIGHTRARDVALPFLLDVEAHHARLRLVEDFHGGPRWLLVPEPGAAARVQERDVPAGGVLLADGDEVLLGGNLAFRFAAREPGSASAVLDLLRGAECLGATRVLLLVPGAGGRVRLGARSARHIPLADLEHEIEIGAERAADGWWLRVHCAAGVRGGSPAGEESQVRLPLPLPAPVTLTARARKAGRPPFALVFAPVEDPAAGGALEP